MRKLSGRTVKLVLLGTGLAAVLAATDVVTGVATPPTGLTTVPLARGTNQSDGTITFKKGTDVAMTHITAAPGGSSGWHSHPGGAVVVVKRGEVTVNLAIGSQCQKTVFSQGQAFFERPGEADDVVDSGGTGYELYVTFPRVPQGESARTNLPDPGTCPGL